MKYHDRLLSYFNSNISLSLQDHPTLRGSVIHLTLSDTTRKARFTLPPLMILLWIASQKFRSSYVSYRLKPASRAHVQGMWTFPLLVKACHLINLTSHSVTLLSVCNMGGPELRPAMSLECEVRLLHSITRLPSASAQPAIDLDLTRKLRLSTLLHSNLTSSRV